MGASFGSQRDLVFLHLKSQKTFRFPQSNGDVFAFSSLTNKAFQHGIPQESSHTVSPRFSVIVWGRRRTLNKRNASQQEMNAERYMRRGVKSLKNHSVTQNVLNPKIGVSLGNEQMLLIIELFIKEQQENVEKKEKILSELLRGRVQSGWAHLKL